MGMSLMKSCAVNPLAPAANPCPTKWTLVDKKILNKVYILKIKYDGCTNFDGIKIMVYLGEYDPAAIRDPHFTHGQNSPIARFKPTRYGEQLADEFALELNRQLLNGRRLSREDT